MIDLKKIADAVRVIREAYAPLVSTVCDGLTAIIDELDPPEPKPLLADARVGDLCKRHDGSFCQITDVIDGFPKLWKTANLEFHTSDGVYYPICTNADNTSPIIATEPLAPEGTAEWAWQMLMLQKPVSHPAEGEFQDTYPIYTKEGFIRCMAKTGWQLYEEPKPQPQYKVGDWVEYKKGKHYQVDSVHDGCCYLSYGKGCGCFSALYSDITRKLDPSEVIVKIGCLSGMVSQCGDKEEEVFALHTKNNAAVIPFAMLDAPTRELVEGLLKAQEERCHS